MWISQGDRKPHLKSLNVVNCSEIRGTYKMLYQQSCSHNLVSFRRAYQCYCQPCKKGTFLFKKGTFSHHFKSWWGTCPQCPPPSYAPGCHGARWDSDKRKVGRVIEVYPRKDKKVRNVRQDTNDIGRVFQTNPKYRSDPSSLGWRRMMIKSSLYGDGGCIREELSQNHKYPCYIIYVNNEH